MNKIIKIIKEIPNPYPEDVFLWNNNEDLDFKRGRFNQFINQVVENTRNNIIKRVEEELEEAKAGVQER